MKRKRILFRSELSDVVFIDDKLVVSRDESGCLFEVGKEVTNDVAELVSMLIKNKDWNNSIWDTELSEIGNVISEISPERSLFILTGGYQEWSNLEHYNRPWCDCYLDFQEEFGFLVINIVKRAKKLSDIRDGFLKYLNLPVLYDFAISRNFVR